MTTRRGESGRALVAAIACIAILALILTLAHTQDLVFDHGRLAGSLLAKTFGDCEPGSKRYDRFTFFNMSNVPAEEVWVRLETPTGDPWLNDPGGDGYHQVGPVAPGASVSLVFPEDASPEPVAKAKVKVWTGGPMGTACIVESFDGFFMTTSTFWFAGQDPLMVPGAPTLCGEALLTQDVEQSPNRVLRPHTTVTPWQH